MDNREISDTELRERLLAFGYAAPPITSTSRGIILKKLQSLEVGTPMEAANVSAVDDPEIEDNSSKADRQTDTVRQRPVKIEFYPKDVGMYSKCAVRPDDIWSRIGVIGTFFILIIATMAIFYLFKIIGDWSDGRYRSVHLADGVFPKCSDGGNPGITCVPDAELKFTESNLNVLRATLHYATIADRCSRAALKRSPTDFIGLYPLFKDEFVKNLLVKELGFKPEESDILLRNSKVLFKANPRFEVKILDEGLLYRNQRLLRNCGLTTWNMVAYSYALYFLTSFAIVLFFYKINRWVSKLRSESDDETRRLIRDIIDLVKQYEYKIGQNFLPVDEVRHWLNSAVSLSEKSWKDVEVHLQEHETCLSLERKVVHGEERDVFCLKN